jgi:hypothetical protein
MCDTCAAIIRVGDLLDSDTLNLFLLFIIAVITWLAMSCMSVSTIVGLTINVFPIEDLANPVSIDEIRRVAE